jgi:hypothetical protein
VTETTSSPVGDGEGERRKCEALSLLQSRRAVFVRRGRRALLFRLLAAGEATADAVRVGVTLPPGLNPKLFGAVPGPLAEAKIIRPAGFVHTARPQGHARPVTVWALADRAAALARLAANPELTEPDADAPAQPTLFD